MCGIAGSAGHPEAPRLTREMIRALRHRGPDGEGVADLDGGSLGMCRLRIRGGSHLPVPFRQAASGIWASYNGELYEVHPAGAPSHVPRGYADEVESLLSARETRGGLDGMYALGFKGPAAPFVLLRDPFGIKPLFWCEHGGGFLFASEASSLAAAAGKAAAPDPSETAELLTFGRVLGHRTPYPGIFPVPPGGRVELGGRAVVHPAGCEPLRPASGAVGADLRPALRSALGGCLLSERPLGLALSGGLDSSLLAFELDALGVEELTTVSLLVEGTGDGIEDLRELGMPAGGAWTRWRHRTVRFGPRDFARLHDEAARIFGAPTRMSSVPLYLALARACREEGIVVLLTGEGSDELLGGYRSYLRWHSRVSGTGLDALWRFAVPEGRRRWLERLLGAESVSGCAERFRAVYADLDSGEPFDALRRLELSLSLEPLLQRVDHCLMRCGIEGRTPFLHGRVPAAAAALGAPDLLRGGETKIALRQAWRGLLAPERVECAKLPFRAPVLGWFSGPLAGWLSRRVRAAHGALEDLGLRPEGAAALSAAAQAGDPEASAIAFTLLSLLSWKQPHGSPSSGGGEDDEPDD
jgi:asparagine synthase (glutamine-hydrolysing)